MRIATFLSAAALAAAGLADGARAANLVTNGDFSTSSYTVSSQFGLAAGGQGVTGWTGNNGYDLWFPSASASTSEDAVGQYTATGREYLWQASASPGGGAFIGLDGEQTPGIQGAVSQTINGLTVGKSYVLSFDWAAAQVASRTGATTDSLLVSLGSQSFLTPVVSNPSEGFQGWFNQTFTFVATSSSEILSFLSIGTPQGLPPMALLDDVSLSVSTPEPVSFAVLGASLVGLAAFHRSRRKST